MSELAVPEYRRGIADVTRDIRIQTGQFLRTAIEIGRLLFEAKAMVEPGGWSRYIEEELPFSHSWANNYMKLYKEYGSDQVSIFGESQAFENLRPTQALELLALPAEDRADFAREHHVEDMSTRQLRQEIQAELEEARKEAEDAQTRLRDLETKAEAGEKEAKEREKSIQALEAGKKAAEAAASKAKEELEKVKKRERDIQGELKKAKENPEIPEAVMERLRKEAEAEAIRKTGKKMEKKLTEAEASARDAREKLEAAQRALKTASPETAVFKALFDQVQADFNRLSGALLKVRQTDPETAEKLKAAVMALLEKCRGAIL